jgi:hypothetical protein
MTRRALLLLPLLACCESAQKTAGDARGAAEAFNQDLKTYPLNGWSLFGLAQAQHALGQPELADETSMRQAAAWQWADAPLTAARY